jgi:hypothetical protein
LTGFEEKKNRRIKKKKRIETLSRKVSLVKKEKKRKVGRRAF